MRKGAIIAQGVSRSCVGYVGVRLKSFEDQVGPLWCQFAVLLPRAHAMHGHIPFGEKVLHHVQSQQLLCEVEFKFAVSLNRSITAGSLPLFC